MECNEDCSQEIKRKIMKSSLGLDMEDDRIGISCDSVDHTDSNYIREGNRAYVVAVHNNDWVIDSLICHQCSVRDVMERVDSDSHIAVVEVVVDANLEDQIVEFRQPVIWELMKAE